MKRIVVGGFDKNRWINNKNILFVGLTDKLTEDIKETIKCSNDIVTASHYTILDVDISKIHHISDWIDINVDSTHPFTIKTVATSLQEFLDTNESVYDEIIMDGIFDKWKYDNKQYDFIFTLINECLRISTTRVCVRLNLNKSATNYNIHYLITYFFNTYIYVGVEKMSNDCYIFTFNKE